MKFLKSTLAMVALFAIASVNAKQTAKQTQSTTQRMAPAEPIMKPVTQPTVQPVRDPLNEFPGAKNVTDEEKQAYIILGVQQGASKAAIKKAYHILARKWHPDRWSSASIEDRDYAKRVFQIVQNAYDYLENK